jgi:hypothetical protein
MAISAIANSGPQPPTLASLLQINRVNPITGRDSDDANGISGSSAPKTGAKPAIIPKLVQDVLKTLSEMGASLSGDQSKTSSAGGANSQELKKSALDFLSSVISAVKPQADGASSKVANPLEQLNAGISKMVSEVNGGSPLEAAVAQSADKLLKASGLTTNANTLGGLLEGLQKSLLDDGSSSGSLVNVTA